MSIALRAGFGQDEVSHGSKRYRVGADRLVVVPPEVAVYLIKNAGFHTVNAPDATPEQSPPAGVRPQYLVQLRHPTAVACSYGGCEYRRNENAEFLVPAAAVADLKRHGFVAVEPADRPSQSPAPVLVSPTGAQQKTQRRGPSAVATDESRGPTL